MTLVRIGHVPPPEPLVAVEAAPGGAAVGVAVHAAGARWDVDARAHPETVYVLAGSAVVTDADDARTHEIGAGDLVVLPAGWSGRWWVGTELRTIYLRG